MLGPIGDALEAGLAQRVISLRGAIDRLVLGSGRLTEVVRQQHAQCLGVLERLRDSLAGAGLEGVGSVADEDNAVATPGGEVRGGPGWVDGIDSGFCDDGADDRVGPLGVTALELLADGGFVNGSSVGRGGNRVGRPPDSFGAGPGWCMRGGVGGLGCAGSTVTEEALRAQGHGESSAGKVLREA